MKLDIDICENTFWLTLWAALGSIFAIIIISILIYNNTANKLILKADTCEKVMAINGALTEKYIYCKKISD